MTCREFVDIRRDYVRQQWLSESARQQATEHLAGCPACRAQLESERALTSALRELAMQRDGIEAPPAVQSAVMAAYARRHEKRQAMAWRKAAWAVPFAAGLLLFVWLSRRAPEVRMANESRAGAPVEAPLETPARIEPAEVASAPAATASRAPRATPVRSPEYVTEFVPLRFGKPLESGEPVVVVRMQLPASQLRRLGLPVAPDATSGMVKADVLLGGDGLAKAIRFVY